MTQRLTAAEANASGHICKRGHVGRWVAHPSMRGGDTRRCTACTRPYRPRPRRPRPPRRPLTAAEANTFEIGCRHGHFGYWTMERKAVCKRCRHESNIKQNYGIPRELYRKMIADAAGRCQCCGKEAALVLDHCHTHGHARGLICNWCNTLAGVVESGVLPRVQDYLSRTGSPITN